MIRTLVTAIALALFMTAGAQAADCPKTSLPEIENEVMCPICGTTLGNAGGPQAQREREFIRERIRRCQSEAEIKTALVAEYGEEVLARPRKRGFELTAYVVPAAGAGLAALLLVAGVLRWRRSAHTDEPAPAPTGGAADRVDADLRNYDL